MSATFVRSLLLALLLAAAGEAAAAPLDVLRASNERMERFVLDNGMVCLVKGDHSAPVVSVQVWVGTGSIHESPYLGAGLSHYLEHMLFKGTTNRAPGEISKAIDNAGGDINAYTSFDRTVYLAELPADAWRIGVDVLSDAVMNANFPEEEWERERAVVQREVAMGRDDPDRILSKLLFRTAYRVHPYQFPVIGHEAVLTRMTRKELRDYYRRHYVPDNMIAVVIGDIDAAAVEGALREAFGGFERRPRAPALVPAEPPQTAPRQARDTGPFHLSRLEWAYHTVALNHPDSAALDVLAKLVGGGRSARLVKDLVEEKQLAVGASAWSWTPREPGIFSLSATFEPEKEAGVIDAIEAQVAAWADAPFSDGELRMVKPQILVEELGTLQTAAGQARSYASGEFYAGDPRFGETYLARIDAVDRDALRRVIRTYLRPENRTLCILAPEQETEPAAVTAGATPEPDAALSRDVLPNGITLLVREDRRLPFVHFGVALRGGLLSETANRVGVTQLMADMLTRGTAERSAEEIAEEIESMGAGLSPFAGRNSFGLTATCLSSDVDAFTALLSDCLLHSAYPEDELEKQRAIQLAAIRQQAESPMFLAQEELRELLFPGHPYQWTSAGTEETVSTLTAEAVRAHAGRLITASNLVIALFGDISAAEARTLVAREFAGTPAGERAEASGAPPRPDLPAVREITEPKEQAIILVGFPGIDIKDPRADALDILRNALSGLSSDLVVEIRDRRGLAYFAGAFAIVGMDPGAFAFYAGTRPDAVEPVLALIDEQIERIAAHGLRDEELRRSRAQLIADHEKSLQNNRGLAQTCALNELYGLGYDYSFSTRERLEAVTPEQVRTAASEILVGEKKATAIVLPALQTAAPAE